MCALKYNIIIIIMIIYIVCRSSKLLYQQLRHEMVLAVVPTCLCKVTTAVQ